MAFWRRKKEDRYITLGLNEPSAPARGDSVTDDESKAQLETPANLSTTILTATGMPTLPPLEPIVTGGAPTPLPQERTGNAIAAIGGTTSDISQEDATSPTTTAGGASRVTPEPAQPGVAQQRPVPSRSSFSNSVLGLDRSLEEL